MSWLLSLHLTMDQKQLYFELFFILGFHTSFLLQIWCFGLKSR